MIGVLEWLWRELFRFLGSMFLTTDELLEMMEEL